MEIISSKVIHDEVLESYSKYLFQIMTCLNMNSSNENKNILDNLVRLGAVNSSTYLKKGGLQGVTRWTIDLYKEKYEYYKKLKKIFPNIIVLSWYQFAEICKKYDLVTDLIQNYIGDIPEENINELIEVKDKLPLIPYTSRKFNTIDSKYVYKLREIRLVEDDKYIRNCVYSSIERFPIFKKGGEGYPYSNHPYSNIDSLKDEIHDRIGVDVRVSDISYSNIDEGDILITAPSDKFKKDRIIMNSITVSEYNQRIKVEDPLAIQLIDGLGIAVHSKWGEEANDIIFNKR